MSDSFEPLKQKLKNEFSIILENDVIKNLPECDLIFPEKMTPFLNAIFSGNREHAIESLTTRSSLLAKHQRWVFSFANPVEIRIFNDNPYKIHIKGLIPLIYSFCYSLIVEVNKINAIN